MTAQLRTPLKDTHTGSFITNYYTVLQRMRITDTKQSWIRLLLTTCNPLCLLSLLSLILLGKSFLSSQSMFKCYSLFLRTSVMFWMYMGRMGTTYFSSLRLSVWIFNPAMITDEYGVAIPNSKLNVVRFSHGHLRNGRESNRRPNGIPIISRRNFIIRLCVNCETMKIRSWYNTFK